MRAKPGRAAAARSTNRRTAAYRARPAGSGGGAGPRRPRREGGDGQRGHRPRRLARDAQRLPAGGQQPHAGARLQEGVGQGGAGVQEVLAVVQHQQHRPRAQVGHQRLQRRAGRGPRGRPPPPGRRGAPGPRRPAAPGPPARRRPGTAAPARPAGRRRPAARRRPPGPGGSCPPPPGPVSVTSRGPAPAGASRRVSSATSPSRPTKLVRGSGRLVGRAARPPPRRDGGRRRRADEPQGPRRAPGGRLRRGLEPGPRRPGEGQGLRQAAHRRLPRPGLALLQPLDGAHPQPGALGQRLLRQPGGQPLPPQHAAERLGRPGAPRRPSPWALPPPPSPPALLAPARRAPPGRRRIEYRTSGAPRLPAPSRVVGTPAVLPVLLIERR